MPERKREFNILRRRVSETRIVAAAPEVIFELLADPSQHPVIDGSGSVKAYLGRPKRLSLGATFGMDMRLGAPYKIRNTVVEFDEGRLIAWRHFYGHRWRWELKAAGPGRTEVTETFDWSTARFPWLISLSGFPRRNKAAITNTLNRLAAMFADRPAAR